MKIFSWNCKGVSNTGTIDFIKDIMIRSKPDFICLVETKSNTDRIMRFCNRFKHCWDWAAIPLNGFSGGIIVLWKRSIGLVTPIANSRLVLHLIISSLNDYWILSVFYNSQTCSAQKTVELPSGLLSLGFALASHGRFQCDYFH